MAEPSPAAQGQKSVQGDGGVIVPARGRLTRVRERILELTGAPTVHCVGDSHTQVFQHINYERYFWHTLFRFCIVNGATATGITKPQSKTQARPLFESYIAKIPSREYVLLCLGEVDCGFVIWFRSLKYNTPVDEQFRHATTAYCDFLAQIQAQGHPKLIVLSVPLPTIRDGQDWGEVADLRKEVRASMSERTRLTLAFNEHLRQFTAANDMLFLDLEPHLINPHSGLVDERFLNSDPLDHHLEHSAIAPILVRLMKQAGFR